MKLKYKMGRFYGIFVYQNCLILLKMLKGFVKSYWFQHLQYKKKSNLTIFD